MLIWAVVVLLRVTGVTCLALLGIIMSAAGVNSPFDASFFFTYIDTSLYIRVVTLPYTRTLLQYFKRSFHSSPHAPLPLQHHTMRTG